MVVLTCQKTEKHKILVKNFFFSIFCIFFFIIISSKYYLIIISMHRAVIFNIFKKIYFNFCRLKNFFRKIKVVSGQIFHWHSARL